MQPNGMQAWIASDDLQAISGGRIPNNNRVDVVKKGTKHGLILTGCAYFLRSICLAMPRNRSISSFWRRLRANKACKRGMSFLGLAGSR